MHIIPAWRFLPASQDAGNRIGLEPQLLCSITLITFRDPDLGPRFGTRIWDPNLGPRFGTPIWDPDLRPRFGTPIWDLDLGPQFGTLIWVPNNTPKI
jgi:hypothetical protein